MQGHRQNSDLKAKNLVYPLCFIPATRTTPLLLNPGSQAAGTLLWLALRAIPLLANEMLQVTDGLDSYFWGGRLGFRHVSCSASVFYARTGAVIPLALLTPAVYLELTAMLTEVCLWSWHWKVNEQSSAWSHFHVPRSRSVCKGFPGACGCASRPGQATIPVCSQCGPVQDTFTSHVHIWLTRHKAKWSFLPCR